MTQALTVISGWKSTSSPPPKAIPRGVSQFVIQWCVPIPDD